MNRINSIAAICCSLLLAGCNSATQSTPTASASPTSKRFKIGVSIPAADHGWTAGLGYWAKESTKDYPNVDWVIKDAKSSEDQISDLENMQTQGVDAVVLVATASAPVTPIAEKLHDAGILIVCVSGGLSKPIADVFIEGDNKAFGRESGEFIVKKLGGKGDIAILEGLPISVNADRVNGAKDVLKSAPGIRIVADEAADWNREKAEKTMENILVSNPHIDGVWAADDDMALGAEAALKAAGRDKNIWILGGGGMKDVVKRVMDKDPLYPADITYPPSMVGFGVATAVSMLMEGKDKAKQFVPKHVVLDLDLVTPENAKDFYFKDSIY